MSWQPPTIALPDGPKSNETAKTGCSALRRSPCGQVSWLWEGNSTLPADKGNGILGYNILEGEQYTCTRSRTGTSKNSCISSKFYSQVLLRDKM